MKNVKMIGLVFPKQERAAIASLSLCLFPTGSVSLCRLLNADEKLILHP